jgi:hypothetical protein
MSFLLKMSIIVDLVEQASYAQRSCTVAPRKIVDLILSRPPICQKQLTIASRELSDSTNHWGLYSYVQQAVRMLVSIRHGDGNSSR